jgi:hypothetical protein
MSQRSITPSKLPKYRGTGNDRLLLSIRYSDIAVSNLVRNVGKARAATTRVYLLLILMP